MDGLANFKTLRQSLASGGRASQVKASLARTGNFGENSDLEILIDSNSNK